MYSACRVDLHQILAMEGEDLEETLTMGVVGLDKAASEKALHKNRCLHVNKSLTCNLTNLTNKKCLSKF